MLVKRENICKTLSKKGEIVMLVKRENICKTLSNGRVVDASLYDIKTVNDEAYCQQLFNDIDTANSDMRGKYKIRLEHIVLDGISFTNKMLKCIDAHDCMFIKCDFSGVTFTECRFDKCNFDGCNFESSESIYSDDNGYKKFYIYCSSMADFIDCKFVNCSFINANFQAFKLMSCYFNDGCDFNSVTFDIYNKFISNVKFHGLILEQFKETVATTPYYPQRCPEEGSFIGWKKVQLSKGCDHEHVLAKLFVPEEAKRSSGFSNKIRVSMAKVLDIYEYDSNTFEVIKLSEDVEAFSTYSRKKLIYRPGEMIYADLFDNNRWDECSNGIHLFLTKDEAMRY